MPWFGGFYFQKKLLKSLKISKKLRSTLTTRTQKAVFESQDEKLQLTVHRNEHSAVPPILLIENEGGKMNVSEGGQYFRSYTPLNP